MTVARFATSCARCTKPVPPGVEVYRSDPYDGWVHLTCPHDDVLYDAVARFLSARRAVDVARRKPASYARAGQTSAAAGQVQAALLALETAWQDCDRPAPDHPRGAA